MIFGTDTAWDFDNDVVTGNVDLEPIFKEVERQFSYTYNLVSEQRTFLGKSYEIYDLSDDDFTVSVMQGDNPYDTPEVKDGAFTVTGARGSYEIEISWKGQTFERVLRL